jgi:hypothetical protein
MQTVFEAAGGSDGLRRLAGAWHRSSTLRVLRVSPSRLTFGPITRQNNRSLQTQTKRQNGYYEADLLVWNVIAY